MAGKRILWHISIWTIREKIWKVANVIAIQKPGKPENDQKSYRPISLLCVMSKLMKRIILNHIEPTVEKDIPFFQAGFRPNRSRCGHVLAIKSYLEKSYNTNTKTGVAFIDLSAANDTVWKHGLLLMLARIIPCQLLSRYLGNSLDNRNFIVLLGDSVYLIMAYHRGQFYLRYSLISILTISQVQYLRNLSILMIYA